MVFWKSEVLINNGLMKRALYLGHKKSSVFVSEKKNKNRDMNRESCSMSCVLRCTC